MSNVQNKSFKPADIEKLKSVLNSCRVTLQHIDDLRQSMKELVAEAAEDLEIKSSEINKAAKALYKEDIADKRLQHEAVEELLELAGFSTKSAE